MSIRRVGRGLEDDQIQRRRGRRRRWRAGMRVYHEIDRLGAAIVLHHDIGDFLALPGFDRLMQFRRKWLLQAGAGHAQQIAVLNLAMRRFQIPAWALVQGMDIDHIALTIHQNTDSVELDQQPLFRGLARGRGRGRAGRFGRGLLAGRGRGRELLEHAVLMARDRFAALIEFGFAIDRAK